MKLHSYLSPLYCNVLYCTVLYRTVPYSTVQYLKWVEVVRQVKLLGIVGLSEWLHPQLICVRQSFAIAEGNGFYNVTRLYLILWFLNACNPVVLFYS
jgi:hypothetical protein